MQQPPDISPHRLAACLQEKYALRVRDMEFLPVGADLNTAAFRVTTTHGTLYFAKLRLAKFKPLMVELPAWLASRGVEGIIAPLTTVDGRLWAELEDAQVVLMPYIAGRDAYEVALTAVQWQGFGRVVAQVHSLPLPTSLEQALNREADTPDWCARLRGLLTQKPWQAAEDDLADKLGAYLLTHGEVLQELIQRTGELGAQVRRKNLPLVLCHADLHPGNLHIDGQGRVYLIDWDDPLLAPRERDLMFVGGGQGFAGATPGFEQRHFYGGYGDHPVDADARSYFRGKRVVEDIVLFAEAILDPRVGQLNREQSFEYLKNNFAPGGMLQAAMPGWEG